MNPTANADFSCRTTRRALSAVCHAWVSEYVTREVMGLARRHGPYRDRLTYAETPVRLI